MPDQLATLGITVDANGAIRSFNQFNQSLDKTSATSVRATQGMSALNALHAEAVGKVGAHSLSYGRLENALAAFSAQTLGVHPVIEKLATSLGKFALGSVEVAGILAGIAAIAAIYDKLTEGAKAAKKAQDDLMQSAREAAYAHGPGGSTLAQQYAGALRDLADAQETRRRHQGFAKLTAVDDARVNGAQILVDNLFRQLPNGQLPTVSVTGRSQEEIANQALEAQNRGIRLRDQYDRAMRETYDFAHGYPQSPLLKPIDLSDNSALSKAWQGFASAPFPGQFQMPNIEMGPVVDQQNKDRDKTLRDQLTKLGILHEDNSMLKDTIASTAQIIGGIIGSALNIGGGGLGSKIGGALGAGVAGGIGTAIGGGIGSVGGSILGPVGSVVGGLLGSALGGLFDHHKKAVDSNTQAINALTAALYNAPSGYKVAGARYRADNGRQIYSSATSEAYAQRMRGGLGNFGMAA